MTYSFGLCAPGSDELDALLELLKVPAVFESQRTDAVTQEGILALDYSGCFAWVYWQKGGAPGAVILFMPQKCGLWEMHLASLPHLRPRAIFRGIVPALEAAFATKQINAVAAPCPLWNPGILSFARMAARRVPAKKQSGISWYSAQSYARRDDRFWDAICFLVLGEKFTERKN